MNIRMLVFTLALGVPAMTLADTEKDKDKTTQPDKTEKTGKLSDADIKVISQLHAANQMQIELGKIAKERGGAQVKSFASTMVSDHTKADKELMSFAKDHGMSTIPKDMSMSDTEHKDMMESQAKLKGLKGAEFDREYINMMVDGHEKLLSKIDSQMSSIQDKDLSKMVADMKPTVQKHLDEAKKLQSNMPVSRTP